MREEHAASAPAPASEHAQSEGPASDIQLHLYARDFRKLLSAERAKSQQLEAANRQLERYAHDFHAAFLREQARCHELERAHHGTLLRLLRAARFKDDETASHLRRIQSLCHLTALHLGWSAAQSQHLADASPMHDIGKIGVPDAILQKPGALTAEEWRIMRRHPSYGALLLQGSGSALLELAREIALCHHERWDGTGYPRGLKEQAIPIGARILAVADTYDALRCRRAYKPAFNHDRACDVILNGDGRTMPHHFDPTVLATFRDLAPQFEEVHASQYP